MPAESSGSRRRSSSRALTFYYCHLFNDCFMWSNVVRNSRAGQGPLNVEDNYSSVGALTFTKAAQFHRSSKVTCVPTLTPVAFARARVHPCLAPPSVGVVVMCGGGGGGDVWWWW